MKEKKALLFIASGGMELSWLYAWATFLTISILHHPFPFPEAVGGFVLSALLTWISQGRGWRIIYILCLQALGFVPLFLRVVRLFSSWSLSFSNQPWLTESFGNPGASLDWFVILLVLSWTFVFWGGGVRLIRRSMDYFSLCSRFDRGLGAFFVLFLAKFLFLVKGGPDLREPVSEFLIFPFLIFSLLAIGLARNQTAAPKDFLPGYRAIGVILSFAVIVLFFGTALVFFFLPYLTMAAEAGYSILKTAAVPLGHVLVKVLRFIFGYDTDLSEKPPEKPQAEFPELGSSGEGPWWMELLGKILAYGVWGLLGLVFLAIIGLSLYFLYQWLLSKTPVDQQKESPRHLIFSWVERIRSFLQSLRRWAMRRIKGYEGTIQLYAALLNWGSRSGLPRSLSETPTEYGSRLRKRFPVLTGEIGCITEAFNKEVYGEIVLDKEHMRMASSAWRKLRHPRHWPRRFKTWFLRPRDEGD